MTVSLVVVSHSSKIASGAVDLAAQMAPNVVLAAAGGTDDERIGTSLEKVMAALDEALTRSAGDGVVVLTDLGSAVMTAESALEFSSTPEQILLADAPLIEGLVAAAVAAESGEPRDAVKAAAEAAGAAWAGTAVGVGNGDGVTGAGTVPEGPLETGEFELINPMGMHARPAAKIAGGLSSLDAYVTVNGVDGTSIMALMALAVRQGGTLHVEARGADAERAVRYVGGLVARGFGEIQAQ